MTNSTIVYAGNLGDRRGAKFSYYPHVVQLHINMKTYHIPSSSTILRVKGHYRC